MRWRCAATVTSRIARWGEPRRLAREPSAPSAGPAVCRSGLRSGRAGIDYARKTQQAHERQCRYGDATMTLFDAKDNAKITRRLGSWNSEDPAIALQPADAGRFNS